MALQSQCATGTVALGACPQAAAPAPEQAGSTEPAPAVTETAAAEPEASPAALAPASARDIAIKSAGGLIAGTFDALEVEDMDSDDAAPSETEVTAVAEVESAAVEAGGASEIAAPPPLALAKRTVTSVPVGLDGQPQWPLTARAEPETVSAAAGAARDVAAAQSPEIEPLAFAAAPEANVPRPHLRPETLTPAPDAASADRVTVANAVNVRAGPAGAHQRLFVLPAGAEVEATHAKDGWVRIVDGDGREGWAYADYLANVDPDQLPAPAAEDVEVAVAAEAPSSVEAPSSSADTRTVKGQGVNVRSGPSSSSGKLFALRGGIEVTVSDEDGGWLRITDPQGRTGWAYQQFLSGG